ncbi:MAG: metalloprotease, partial [uncultured bacterium]
MILENVLYIFLALLGLSILVFIHELGHYLMAKKVGMRVLVFSIGFGKPIISWKMNKVKWQIGILPFGGYVKIAGMEKDGDADPLDIKDGFYGKKPLDRIKVTVMGPFINIFFAFLIFAFIWFSGGRDKPFSDFTKKIGYVDSKSVLYDHNVRPGDEIVQYNKKDYTGYKDIIYNSVLNGKEVEIKGYLINYFNNKKVPFEYTLKKYRDDKIGKEFSTIGIFAP